MLGVIQKVAFSLFAAGLLGIGLVGLALYPRFLYAHRTVTPHYIVYHHRPLDPAFLPRLAQARALVQQSTWFDPGLRLNICLNDGSPYPGLVEKVWGPAFAWGFYRNVVLSGAANAPAGYVAVNGYEWNLVRLLAHEATHCYQVHRLGLWRSNPLARYPAWKWEGYAEYVAQQGPPRPPLGQQVRRLQQAEAAAPRAWALVLADGTSVSREYARYQLLTAYCLEVKNMSYPQLLTDTTSERVVSQQLAQWSRAEKSAPR